ncbi:hypothetical protein ACT4X4_03100 [Acinetobacter baumannii]
MTMFLAPYTAIADIDGSPLDAGFLYLGEYGKDPASFPVEVFWDADFTTPASQPIRTRNGYPVRNGSPAKIYLKVAQHSIAIKNRKGAFVLVDFYNKGWDASFVVDASGENQQEINNMTRSKTPSIKDYGAKYDGSNDKQALIDCRAANEHFLVNTGTTNIEVFANERHAVGLGKPTVIVDPTANPVAVQLLDGSVTENIDFVSSSDSKEWQRAEVKSNSIIKNVGFYNFKHDSALPNAWGNYLENVRNISYENCRYGRNSQSDIAIVDNVQDVVINNAQNAEDGGVYLNIEPNNVGNISNINLIGGTYRKLTLLENSANNYGIKSIVVNGSLVKYLSYRGAEVSFINAQIDEIEGNFFGYSTVNEIANAKLEFAGSISINNAALLSNRIQDEYLTDLDSAGSSAWEVYQSESTQQFGRTNTDSLRGDYTTLNIDKTGYTYATTRNFIDVTESTALAFINRARVNNNPGTINVELAHVRFYDSADTLLYTHIVYSNRGALGSNIGFRNDVAIIKKPAGATKAKVSLRSRPDCSVDIARVGLFDIRLNAGGGNFNSVVASFANPVKTILKKSALPTGTFGLMYKFGDVLELPSGTQYRVATNGTATTQATFSLIDKRKVYASFNAVAYNLLANKTREIIRTVSGANVGDTVVVAYSQVLGDSSQVWAQVTAANTVTIYHKNFTASTISINTNINVIVS